MRFFQIGISIGIVLALLFHLFFGMVEGNFLCCKIYVVYFYQLLKSNDTIMHVKTGL